VTASTQLQQRQHRRGAAGDQLRRSAGRFFNDIRFNLVRITLPTKVQNAVDDAQAAFAQVTQAQARVQSALTAMRLTGLPTGPVGILGSR
jgi:hypothetical protein